MLQKKYIELLTKLYLFGEILLEKEEERRKEVSSLLKYSNSSFKAIPLCDSQCRQIKA